MKPLQVLDTRGGMQTGCDKHKKYLFSSWVASLRLSPVLLFTGWELFSQCMFLDTLFYKTTTLNNNTQQIHPCCFIGNRLPSLLSILYYYPVFIISFPFLSCPVLSSASPSMRGSTPLDVAAASVMDNNELALALREPDLEKVRLTNTHTHTHKAMSV